MKYILLVLFLWPHWSFAYEDFAMKLIDSFQSDCESLSGGFTSSALEELGRLRDIKEALKNQPGCGNIDVNFTEESQARLEDSIRMGQVEIGLFEAKKKMAIAVSDLKKRNSGQIQPGSQQDRLTPSASDLQYSIDSYQKEIEDLKYQRSVNEQIQRKENYAQAVGELGRIAGDISSMINTPCLQGQPHIQSKMLSAVTKVGSLLVGSGASVGIEAAGRVLHGIFDFVAAKRERKRNADSLPQNLAYQGLNCALEVLNKRNCNLVRQKRILDEAPNAIAGKPCPPNKDCTKVEKLLHEYRGLERDRELADGFIKWLERRFPKKEASEVIRAKSRLARFERKSQASIEELNRRYPGNIEKAMSHKFNPSKGTEIDEDTERQARANLVQEVREAMVNESLRVMLPTVSLWNSKYPEQKLDERTQNALDLANKWTPIPESVQKYDLQRMCQDRYYERHSEENFDEFSKNKYDQLLAEAQKVAKEYRIPIPRNVEHSSFGLFRFIANSVLDYSRVDYSEYPGFEHYYLDMTSVEPGRVGCFVPTRSYDLNPVHDIHPSVEEKAFLKEFFTAPINSAGANRVELLVKLSSYLSNEDIIRIQSDNPKFSFHNPTEVKDLYNNLSYSASVARSSYQGDGLTQFSGATHLIETINAALDGGQEALNEIIGIIETHQSIVLKDIKAEVGKDSLQALEVYSIINDINVAQLVEEFDDVHRAWSLSTSIMERYSNIFRDFLEPAINYTDKKDENGKALRQAVADSVPPYAKDEFCFRLLGLIEVPEKPKSIRSTCRSASYGSEKFGDYIDRPFAERVCVYEQLKAKSRPSRGSGSGQTDQ